MNTRSSGPEFLMQWLKWMCVGKIKCYHTCEHYVVDELCMEFFM